MKKEIKITLIILASLVLIGVIFGFTDYMRLKNNKKPIFTYRNANIYNETILLGTEYFGLGYSIIDCDKCTKQLYFNPLYLSSFGWFIGTSNINRIDVVKSTKCDSKAKFYYSLDEDRDVYTYCLDNIIITEENNNSSELNDYLKTFDDAIYYIINNYTTNPGPSFDDGGSKIYSGEDFNILVCKTLSGNNDIYIGDKEMGYKEGFCK